MPDVSAVIGEEHPGDEGDWLVWRLVAEPATLNPITAKDLYASLVTSGSIFESLLEYDIDIALSGRNCPLPILKTKATLVTMNSGEILKMKFHLHNESLVFQSYQPF